MDKKLKHLVELPSWIKRTAKENSSKLPLANPEHEVAIDNAQAYLTGLAERFDQLPKGEKISIWNTPAFIEKAKTSSPELMVITLYEDLINTSVLLNRLAIQRTMELAKSFVRSTRTNEIYVQAITGRSILEMGIVVADSMRAALDALFKKIADAPKGSLPVYEDTETFNFKVDIEESIYKAAFGTRIGGGTFGNKKHQYGVSRQFPEKLCQART